MNLDADELSMAPNETRENYNVLEENNSGRLVNLKGFTSVMSLAVNSGFTLPSGTFKCMGTCQDIENSTLIYLLCDTVGTAHSILQMNTETKLLTWIIKAEPLLNFQPTYRVSANCLENLLYFTDGYFGSFLNNDFNPPRKINIAKAIKYTAAYPQRWSFYVVGEASSITGDPTHLNKTAYGSLSIPAHQAADKIVAWALDGINRYKNSSGYSVVLATYTNGGTSYVVTDRPWQDTDQIEVQIDGYILDYAADMYFGIDWQVMDVIKWKPMSAPGVSYSDDITKKVNHLKNKLFQFAYRHIYDDYEKTVLSPISEIPLPTSTEVVNGNYYDAAINNNVINAWFDTGPMEVNRIEMLVREGTTGNWRVVEKINKYNENGECLLTSDIYNPFLFYNDGIGEYPSDQLDMARPYDMAPDVVMRQDIIEKNRLIYGNYSEGKDNQIVDLTLGYKFFNLPKNEFNELFTIYRNYLHKIPAYTDNLYEVHYVWYQEYTADFSAFFLAGRVLNITMSDENNAEVVVSAYALAGETYAQFLVRVAALINTLPNCYLSTYVDVIAECVSSADNIPGHEGEQAVLLRSFRAVINGSNLEIWCRQNIDPSVNIPDTWPRQVALQGRMYEASNVRYSCFKSGARHYFGVVYGKDTGNEGAVNIASTSVIDIPYMTAANITAPTDGFDKDQLNFAYLNWSINTLPPVFADWYQIYYAGSNISWYLDYNVPSQSITRIRVADEEPYVKIFFNQEILDAHEKLLNYEIPSYVWQKGDRIRFCFLDTGLGDRTYFTETYDFEILGFKYPGDVTAYQTDNTGAVIIDQYGNKVFDNDKSALIVEDFDITVLGIINTVLITNTQMVTVEIYRMRPVDKDSILYYPITERINIINPHTSGAMHGEGSDGLTAGESAAFQTISNPATGWITFGDSFFKQRYNGSYTFPVEALEYSDYYTVETRNLGLPNIVNQYMFWKQYIANLRYGGRLIQDTRINDMSKFLGADYISLADKYGAIHHIEEVGFTLKILQKSKPSSLYIGRAGVTQPSADAKEILSSTKDVLGTLIVHDSDFGTVHGGSVVKNENRAYWFDFYAHAICRDAGNGIQNLTELYGLKKFMQDKCKLFGSASNVDVVSAYDQTNEIVWFSFTDKTTAANSFTIGFHDSAGRSEDGFVLFGSFVPDNYGSAKQTLTSFKSNVLWLHNSDTALRCKFYGTQYKYWLTIVGNKFPLTIKRWLQMLISSNKVLSCPDAGDIEIPITGNSPTGMLSLLKPAALTPVQGKWVAELGKNMTTNQATAELADLIEGDDLEGQAITIRLEGTETTEHKILAVELQGVTT